MKKPKLIFDKEVKNFRFVITKQDRMKKYLLTLAAGVLFSAGAMAQGYPPAISLKKIGGSGVIQGTDSLELILDVALACQGGTVIAPTATTVNIHGGVGLETDINGATGKWQKVVNWDGIGANGQSSALEVMGAGKFRMRFRPSSYYGTSANETIYRLSFVFNAGGWANGEGKDTTSGTGCKDFFVELGQFSTSTSNLGADVKFGVFPNPATDFARVNFTLNESKNVSLKIYNILGKEVKTLINGNTAAGIYSEVWDGTDYAGARVANGTYFARIVVDNEVATERIVFTR